MTMTELLQVIQEAIDNGYEYIGVEVVLPEGHHEVIINKKSAFEDKLNYYKSVYNEDLTHKHNPNIKITGAFFGDYWTME